MNTAKLQKNSDTVSFKRVNVTSVALSGSLSWRNGDSLLTGTIEASTIPSGQLLIEILKTTVMLSIELSTTIGGVEKGVPKSKKSGTNTCTNAISK